MANDTKYGYLISPAPQFLDTNGKPISGGKLKVYIAGTTTKVTTYSDWNLTKNTWPIVLDAMGTCQVIVYSANLYKFVLESAEGEEPLITRDNVSVSSEQQIIYTTANRVDSSDGTVDVTATTDPDTGMVTYDISIQKEIDRAEEAEGALAEDIADEIDRAKTAEKAAKTEVAQGSNVSVAESTGANGQKVYTVGVDLSGYKTRQTAVTATGSATKTVAEITQDANGNMTVTYTGINFPVKSVTSSDNSVTVTNDGNGNLDLSVSIPSDSQTYGIFTSLDGSTWRKTSGNIDSLGTLDDANYHYTVIVPYSVSTLRNVIDQISLAGGKLTDKRDIDLSYVHTGYVEFSADKKTTVFAPVITMPTGVGIYPAAYLFVHSTAGGGSGGGSGGDTGIVVFEVSYSADIADYVYPTYQEVAASVSAGKMPVLLEYVPNSPVRRCFVFRWLSGGYAHFDNDSQYVEISNENVVETGYINDKNLAADYDPTATYSVGNYCMYHNELFVCTTDISVAEEWDGSKWQRISMSDIVGNVETLLAAI